MPSPDNVLYHAYRPSVCFWSVADRYHYYYLDASTALFTDPLACVRH